MDSTEEQIKQIVEDNFIIPSGEDGLEWYKQHCIAQGHLIRKGMQVTEKILIGSNIDPNKIIPQGLAIIPDGIVFNGVLPSMMAGPDGKQYAQEIKLIIPAEAIVEPDLDIAADKTVEFANKFAKPLETVH